MAVNFTSYQQTVMAKELQVGHDENLVGVNFCNQNFIGDAMNAAAVTVNKISGGTVKDYVAGADDNAESPTTTPVTVNIDHKKTIITTFDEVEGGQTADFGELQTKRIYKDGVKLANEEDVTIFTEIAKAVKEPNVLGTDSAPLAITDAASAMNIIRDLETKLDEANVPVEGRKLAMPPAFYNVITADPTYSTAMSVSKNNATGDMGTGFIGQLLSFDCYKTTNIPKTAGGKYQVIASHPDLNTLVPQQTFTKFKDGKGASIDAVNVNVYGVKAIYDDSAKAIVDFQ